ncbi:hypothetical protein B6U67_00740 [Methanosarcinales archaeon ex4484_138]|nr:MAG: hypothetical protein B6U67_00740 [Methanosarcinales archaeon ex4484_138]
MPVKLLQKEKPKHREAFEYYYQVRSLRKVAQKFGVSNASVEKWNKSFNWQERLLIRDQEIADKVEKELVDSITERKAKYLKMVEAVMSTAFERQEDGTVRVKIKCNKASDLQKLIETALKLMGEPERQEIQHRGIEDITFKFEVEEKDANQDTA